jgi:hypothetical protein
MKQSISREQQIDALMNSIPPGDRYRWCKAYACACMGCVNWYLLSKGFTEADHAAWVSRNPKPAGNDNNTYYMYTYQTGTTQSPS